jgi:hypothetical protein
LKNKIELPGAAGSPPREGEELYERRLDMGGRNQIMQGFAGHGKGH